MNNFFFSFPFFMKCSKKYVVGTALVFMHLAAVEYFCPVTFFFNIQTFDYRLGCGSSMT